MSDIFIKQIIAHDMILEKDKPDLESDIFNLTTIPSVVLDFFSKHIQTSLNARQIKACRFKHETSRVKTTNERLSINIADIPLFVKETRELTTFLFDTMKSTSSRSDGTLFFLIYDDSRHTYLAILKMDPNQGIQINKTSHTLNVQENMLPNPEDKLHKCAFIKMGDELDENEAHLHVLDRQKNAGEVSKFFLNTFLEAEEILNDKIMTKRVIEKLNQRSYACTFIDSEEDLIQYQVSVEQTFTDGKQVDLDIELEQLFRPFINEEFNRLTRIETFKSELREEFEDVNFRFTAKKEKPNFVSYVSEGKEIKLEFPLLFEGSLVRVSYDNEDTIIRIGMKLKRKQK